MRINVSEIQLVRQPNMNASLRSTSTTTSSTALSEINNNSINIPNVNKNVQSCSKSYNKLESFLEKADINNAAFVPMIVTETYSVSDWPEKELNISCGSRVMALFKRRGWLFVKSQDGRYGYIPYDIAELCGFQQNCSCCNESTEMKRLGERLAKLTVKGARRALNFSDDSFNSSVMSSPETLRQPPTPVRSRPTGTQSSRRAKRKIFYGKTLSDFKTLRPRLRNPVIVASTLKVSSIPSEAKETVSPDAEEHFYQSLPLYSPAPEMKENLTKDYHGPRLTLLFDFEPETEHEVRVKKNEVVILLNEDDEDWIWIKKKNLKEGYIPRNFAVNLQLLNLDPHTKTTYL